MDETECSTHLSLKARVHNVIGCDSLSAGRSSRYFNIGLMLLIVANVLAVVVESVAPIQERYSLFFETFELFSVIIFSIEYILRLWTITEDPRFSGTVKGRARYARTPLAIIDLLAVLPFYLPMFIPVDLRFLRMLRLFRMFRIMKLARYSVAFTMIKNTFVKQKDVLAIAFFLLVMLLLVASSLMYYVESAAQPDAFASIPETMWWAIATLTTVGYGDMTPITPLGKFLGAFVAILGIAMFAIPTGVLATGFIEEMQNRKNLENKGMGAEATIELLERLGRLRESGVLTEEEFLEQKRLILDGPG